MNLPEVRRFPFPFLLQPEGEYHRHIVFVRKPNIGHTGARITRLRETYLPTQSSSTTQC